MLEPACHGSQPVPDFQFADGALQIQAKLSSGRRSWFLEAERWKIVEGRRFMRLCKGHSTTAAILCCRSSRPPHDVMPHTDIVEQIVALKDKAVKDAVNSAENSKAKTFRWRNKDVVRNFFSISEVCNIDVPETAGVPGVQMSVLATKRGRSGTAWVELTSENIAFLSEVVAAQFAIGNISNKRVRSACRDDEGDAGDAGDGGDDAGIVVLD